MYMLHKRLLVASKGFARHDFLTTYYMHCLDYCLAAWGSSSAAPAKKLRLRLSLLEYSMTAHALKEMVNLAGQLQLYEAELDPLTLTLTGRQKKLKLP